jgi:CxxC-x17-CxxC domain-containing protein
MEGSVMFEDKTLTCKDCRETFVFTVGEQGFYLEKGLLNEPQRCANCRECRRRERTTSPQVTAVVCAECSRETTVPFVPRLGRPVYCNDCYSRMRSSVA